MIVAYEAVDEKGKPVSATLEASDVRSAIDALRSKNLTVTHIEEKLSLDQSQHHAHDREIDFRVTLSIKQLVMFTRQLAMLLTAGSGVVAALQTITRQFTKPAQVSMIRHLMMELEEGTSLADALRKFPRTFDSGYCAVVAAGEATATLAPMFDRLSKMVGKKRAMHNKVIGATAYPALLTLLSSAIVMVLMFFVLPRFNDMFSNLGVELPGSTLLLLGTANFAATNWYVVLGVASLILGGIIALFTTDGGRNLSLNVGMRLPMVGKLISGLIQGETFRVLGMLVGAKVGLLEAIELVRGVTRHKTYQQLYDAMELEVTSGGSISRALESSGMIEPYICQAVYTGEESGQLGSAMTYVADILDEDNTELLGTVTKLLEPTILIAMGLVVGFVAISLFMPMFDMTSAL